MPVINLVVGEKGGVGKSQVALVLIYYTLSNSHPLVICEADRSNGDVGRACEGKANLIVVRPYFSEDGDELDKADDLLDVVFDANADAIVNCPAQSQRALFKWLSQGSADLALEEGLQFRFWFVTSGEYDSMNLFLESVAEFNYPHVLVRNHFFIDRLKHDYSNPETEAVNDAISKHSVRVVDFPRFLSADLDHIKAHSLTFSEAMDKTGGLTLASRSRVRRALQSFSKHLDILEPKNNDTPQPEEESAGHPTGGQKRTRKKQSA